MLAFLIIGTGIGGAIAYKGDIIRGKNFESGEFGYMLIDNKSDDNLSKLATLPNIARKIKEVYKKDVTSFDLFNLYLEKKEPYYKEVEKSLDNLCRGIYNISYLLDPDLIYIGGAISADERYIEEICKKLSQKPFKGKKIKIKAISHFNDNNLYGAFKNLRDKIKADKKLRAKEDI